MTTKRFTKDHEWIAVDGEIGTVGITDYAQGQLGDIVYVEVPAVGKNAKQGEQIAVVESVKAASEVYAPVTGTVSEGNAALAEQPQLVNSAAEGAGWFFKMKLAQPAELNALMDEAAYRAYVGAKS
jgi:glycine cleavage system H protein